MNHPRPEWATQIPGRRGGAFKVHASLGLAQAALSYAGWGPHLRGGKLLRWVAEQWVTELDVVRGTHVDELPWRKA
jgi:hypothetical protein